MENIGWQEILVGALVLLATFTVSLLVISLLILRIPPDYFRKHRVDPPDVRHPALRWTGRILKNVLGYSVIALGLVMSLPLVPGQGFLTILIGVMLIDFPGKRRLERAIISRPRILRTVNQFRVKRGRAPLELD